MNRKGMMFGKRMKRRGVPIGYPEDWSYRGHWHERKIGNRKWKFKFTATKRRKARSYGSFGKGTTGRWEIRATQLITKTGKGRYQTTMIGTKKSLGFNVKNPRDRRYK